MAGQRKPAVIRKLEGNRARTPIPREIEAVGRPRCPERLSAVEKAIWRDVVASLPIEMLTGADEQVLERMAIAWATFREADDKLKASSLLVKGQFGNVVRNPLLIIRKQAAEEMETCGQALALSPMARTRITAPEDQDRDPLALLLGEHERVGLIYDRGGDKLDS